MTISRRDFLKAGAAGGAMLLARPTGLLAQGLGPEGATSRASRLFPGTALAHADLHNHTLLSDGDGNAEQAFASMRSFGLDVAALTDHSAINYGAPQSPCMDNKDCQAVAGIDEESWGHMRDLAKAASEDHAFIAMRGFEWSSPTLGHMNVWFSERWIDPLHTGGATTGEGAQQFVHDESPVSDPTVLAVLDAVVRAAPTTGASMALFYDWLKAAPERPGLGGGFDALAGFNHPGREPGRFSYFALDQAARDRVVSIEAFNRGEDYLFEGTDSTAASPLNEALNKGWRVGMLGVSDEHGTVWGDRPHRGRSGLWVKELTTAGVREAMLARRFFATIVGGLRLDASANGVRMGGSVPHRSGPVRFELDIDRGAEWYGRPLSVQVLRPGTGKLPVVAAAHDVVVPTEFQPVISFTADLKADDGSWVLLRVTDPSAKADGRADAAYKPFGGAIAYASPFWLDPS